MSSDSRILAAKPPGPQGTPRQRRPSSMGQRAALQPVASSIQTQVDELVGTVHDYHPAADCSCIRGAFDLAAKVHDGQRRKSGEPYLIHPVSVAQLISQLRLDVPSICAGLLHDGVEDTELTLKEIEKQFSSEVAFLVDGVTKLGRLPWSTREERQAENFRKMLMAMAKDIRVILIKLADRTDNMRTLQHMPENKQERIARETMDIYAPLANRLGIYWMRAELEDLAFRYLFPQDHEHLTRDLAATAEWRKEYVTQVEEALRHLMAENSMECEVSGRPKHLWSIYSKMRRTQRTLEQIHDVVAFRIITKNIRDCYAALGLVHERFTPVPGRFKDYVAMPKPNRYQSLHTSLIGPSGERMEVQIRTEEMHRVCDQGIAAHWVYKEGKSVLSTEDRKKFSWLRQLVEIQHDLKDPAEFIDAVKIDLFSDEVYVFTPKGDVKAFRAGSTPIDFAFSVHTEVGLHCCGARVNHQIVPLRYQLQNGDTVEIMTSPHQRPNKDWLKYCATARARSKIRHYIRRARRERGRALGRELLERQLRKYSLSIAKLEEVGALNKAAKAFKLGNKGEELLMYIGFGKLTPQQVVEHLAPDAVRKDESAQRNPLVRILRKVARRQPTSGIRVHGENDVLVRFAQCCNPLPGDPIIGFITRGRGVTVHKMDCTKGLDLDPDRRTEVDWDTDARVEHPVRINIHAEDKPGLLAEMSKTFADQGVNISQADCRTMGNGQAVNSFRVHLSHRDHLKQVMRAIRKIKGVFSVDRA